MKAERIKEHILHYSKSFLQTIKTFVEFGQKGLYQDYILQIE